METVVSLYGVQPLRIGGVETFLREITVQLRERGFRHVVVFHAEPSAVAQRYLQDAGLPYEVVPALNAEGLAAARAIDDILCRHRPTVLHFSFMTLLGPIPWIARLRGVKRVFFTDQTSRLTSEIQRTSGWKRVIARILQIPVTGIMCVSKMNRRMGVERGVFPGSRTFVLYNGSELPSVQRAPELSEKFRRRFQISPDALVVAVLCWMIPEKGISDLLDAAQAVLARSSNAHFVIGGAGPSLEDFKAQARRLGIADKVTFTGLIENPQEEGILAACDILCQPSRWQEAFGWVISEAMGFERAVVATDVGGIPEVVEHGVTGLLCPPSQPPALAETLTTLLADPVRRKRMGIAGRQRAIENFDLTRKVSELLVYYGVPPAKATAATPAKASRRVPEGAERA
ncbi:MAG: glycosyltransferase family 4 protein [Acidobacteria bacterium]|nr:glycosyltransferase family 4 protein [Acidobacteriota bacterium]